MAGVRNLYNETDYFLGNENDLRGRLFVALNYKGTDFSKGVNTVEKPNIIVNEQIYQLMIAQNYNGKDNLPNNVISTDFIDFVRSVATYHKSLDNVGSLNKQSTELGRLNYVYNNWENMTMEGRDFYNTFVNFVCLTDSKIASPIPGHINGDVRVNLKKIDPSNTNVETVFCHTLPYLPENAIDENGNKLEVNYLHDLYNQIIMERVSQIPQVTQVTQFGGTIDLSGWDNLNKEKFLRNIMNVNRMQVQYNFNKTTNVETPLDGIYDMATNNIYTRDENGILLNKGAIVGDQDMSAGLPKGPLVFECLLSGDAKALKKCLTFLTSENIFNIAKDEIAKMNPSVIFKLLDTFCVVFDKFGNIETYLEWRYNIQQRLAGKLGVERGNEASSKILNNTKLVEYIRSIMELVRENPALTSTKNYYTSTIPDKSNKKISYYIKPQMTSRSVLTNLSGHLAALNGQLQMGQVNFMESLAVPLNVANIGFGPNILSGGGCVDETANQMRALFHQILKQMNINNKKLDDEDVNKIEQAISQIEKNNANLNQVLSDLKNFLKLNPIVLAGLDVNVKLKDIKGLGRLDINSALYQLNKKATSITNEQNNLLNMMINKILSPLLDVAGGGINSSLRLI
jgi:hypothetical protein